MSLSPGLYPSVCTCVCMFLSVYLSEHVQCLLLLVCLYNSRVVYCILHWAELSQAVFWPFGRVVLGRVLCGPSYLGQVGFGPSCPAPGRKSHRTLTVTRHQEELK